ncbi:MAG TPA: M23 family metallopeptidase [Anaerolineales bacterium]|jgi:murein DD-endopeptidase MepM/ murein hydrolase activator NlpD
MKNTPLTLLLVSFLLLSACGAAPKQQADLAQIRVQPTLPFAPTQVSAPEPVAGCPNPDCLLPRATASQASPLRLSLPTPGDEPVSAWRPPQYPVPLAYGEFDHFYFARPIAADVVNWPVANYRYGGTELSPGITHTGVDIPSQAGTPVLAAGPGIITWAGWGLFSSTPDNIKDPYGIAVAIRHDFGYHGQQLYTVYAHLQDVDVAVGQWVNTGTKIGRVGDTGYTTGPHLHFEMRLGKDSIYYTRNPELWIAPPQGWGVLAGRVMEANRDLAHSEPVTIRSLQSGREWIVNTYGPEAVNSDEYYAENMVISDLPAGVYEVKISLSGTRNDSVQVTVNPGRVSYFVYRASYGFTSTALPPVLTPTPAPTLRPTRAVPTVTGTSSP